MLVARNDDGECVEATRRLSPSSYTCPVCHEPVVLKPGRVVVPHFAHRAGLDCLASGESPQHLAAKRLLAARFRDAGYAVVLEDPYPDAGRRVDVAVTVPGKGRYAVEVQDSAISALEIDRRIAADRDMSGGFRGTQWIWTAGRVRQLLAAPQGSEVRVPSDVLYSTFGHLEGHCLDVEDEQLWAVRFEKVVRPGREYPDRAYPGRGLKTVRKIHRRRIGFDIFGKPGRAAIRVPRPSERPLVRGEEDVVRLLLELRESSLLDDDNDTLTGDFTGQMATLAVVAFGWPRTRALELWVVKALRFAGVRDIGSKVAVRRICERVSLDGGKILEPVMICAPGPAPA